jgi:hypothetical protein
MGVGEGGRVLDRRDCSSLVLGDVVAGVPRERSVVIVLFWGGEVTGSLTDGSAEFFKGVGGVGVWEKEDAFTILSDIL